MARSAKNIGCTKPSITHIGEYVRGIVHTNTVEGYYSIFKRGIPAL
jgi:hypothetical protein